MDCATYRSVAARFPETLKFFHHNVYCHNLLDIDLLKEISKNFSISSGVTPTDRRLRSFPFYKPFEYPGNVSNILKPGSCTFDRSQQAMKEKKKWLRYLKRFRPTDYRRAQKILKTLKEGDNYEDIDSSLIDYIYHFNNDPEPLLKNYNWFYSGGNITGVYHKNKYFLIGADEIEGSVALGITQLNSDTLKREDEDVFWYFDSGLPILQLCSASVGKNILVATRHRNHCNLLKLTDTEEIEKVWSSKSIDHVVTCCDLGFNGKVFASVNSDRDIVVFDIEVDSVIHSCRKKDPNRLKMSWYQILFGESKNEIYLADRHSIARMDLRVDSFKPIMTYKPDGVTSSDCEVICNVMRSEYNSYLAYLVTSHSLIQVDVRKTKNLQRWTHLMKSTPQFGRACQSDHGELIVLQSEDPDEMVVVVNEVSDDGQLISVSSPHIFSNGKAGLRNANYRGVALNYGVRERCNYSMTGLEIAKDCHNEPHVFTINGGYDVFETKLCRKKSKNRYAPDFDSSAANYEQFEDHVKRISAEKTIVADEIVDMKRTWNDFEASLCLCPRQQRRRRTRPRWALKEMFKKESLSFYRDLLAPRLLKTWGIIVPEAASNNKSNEE